MINLPPGSLKVSYFDDDDEFIREALRRRNYSEPCWCGSGHPYKKCHRVRESRPPFKLMELLNQQRKVFWQSRNCMHPDASPSVCEGRVIDSHTIQRKGPLSSIIDAKNHVSRIDMNFASKQFEITDIGWRKASVFPGFCSFHDNLLFSDIEKFPFTGTHHQCILQSFRNVCSELYKKRALIDSLTFQSSVTDRGQSLDRQIEIQKSIQMSLLNQGKSIRELEHLWDLHNKAIQSGDGSLFESKVFFFEGDIALVSAAAIQVDYDLEGNQYCDLFDLEEDAESICYCVLNTENGGAIMFCWPSTFEAPKRFVESFDNFNNSDKGDIFAQYCFLSSEYSFFSRKWWNNLSDSQINYIFDLYKCTYYEGGAFEATPEKLLNWRFD